MPRAAPQQKNHLPLNVNRAEVEKFWSSSRLMESFRDEVQLGVENAGDRGPASHQRGQRRERAKSLGAQAEDARGDGSQWSKVRSVSRVTRGSSVPCCKAWTLFGHDG